MSYPLSLRRTPSQSWFPSGLLYAIATLVFFWPDLSTGAPTVSTYDGTLNGTSVLGGAVARFTVPYARPPVGALRLADPVAFPNFRHFDGSTLPPPCPQTGRNYSEDCLFITIYTPSSALVTGAAKLPVLFWIHGGSFYNGASSDIDGANLANRETVVVITVQYRLGVLGQLRLDRVGLRGNYAIKDLIVALQYVQSRISAFGGDKALVTLAGQSSGGEMIRTLLGITAAKPLFTRAIIHSAPLAYGDLPPVMANEIGELASMNCTTIKCLRSASVESILAAQTALQTSTSPSFAPLNVPGLDPLSEFLRPNVDGSLVPIDFAEAVRQDVLLPSGYKSVIFTNVKDESCSFVASLFTDPFPANELGDVLTNLQPTSAAKIIASRLYKTSNSNEDGRTVFASMVTDELWICSIQQTVLNLSSSAVNTGSYWLAEFDLGLSYDEDESSFCTGKVSHSDDIRLLFNSPLLTPTTSQTRLIAEVQSRWGAFIRTGSPNPAGVLNLPRWKPATDSSNLNLLFLGGSSTTSGQGYVARRRESVSRRSCRELWGVRVEYENQKLQAYYN
ncbi:hypothetical protein MVLG_06474 [Microbotryum lychnidis-dioicae p1A1 Lamole]|uniref:Carboxylic ester hydrolase n=1 Tax=Microbotryum lychnidis-dioicae (strain p1A1 Lamole / MvSl-1064) TaxID=683840 RepID=U5HHE1_USTV1|nr:hypothetical protein MVLG_06474 [Microbotryum lychnidis-dioicae p1A1 Lamole]|eukprot:KDE03006.1 hypothetical protein MVLG_06474 [Microbotryum lychnidis-dioicae p1A1 Lamole]